MVYDYKEKFSVQGKKCIVTGGAQGLSRGMAEGLLENGAEVVLMDLQKEKLEQAVEEYCKKGYKATFPKKQNWTGCSMRLWNCWEVSWML